MHNKGQLRTTQTVTVLGLALLVGLAGGTFLLAEHEGVHTDPLFELGDGVDPAVPGIGDILGLPEQPGPDWDDLFNADRTPKDVYDEFGEPGSNGVPDFLDTWGSYRSRRDAAFIADDVAVVGGSDDSVFVEPGVVGSGTVDVGFDLGNAYAYTGFANLWNLTLYAGVERLSTAGGTIVFEFNRKLFTIGSAGEILGQKSIGDLQIRATFSAGILSSLVILRWELVDVEAGAYAWLPLEVLPINPDQPAEQCNAARTVCAVCNGISVGGGAWPSYDAAGNQITTLLPDTFLEFGINVSALLGHNWQNFYNTRYTTIQISTFDSAVNPAAHDYALGTFTRAGRLAQNSSQ